MNEEGDEEGAARRAVAKLQPRLAYRVAAQTRSEKYDGNFDEGHRTVAYDGFGKSSLPG